MSMFTSEPYGKDWDAPVYIMIFLGIIAVTFIVYVISINSDALINFAKWIWNVIP